MIPSVAWYRQAYVRLQGSADTYGRTVAEVETRTLTVLAPTPYLAILNLRADPEHWSLAAEGFFRFGAPIRLRGQPSTVHGPAEKAIHKRACAEYLGKPFASPYRNGSDS